MLVPGQLPVGTSRNVFASAGHNGLRMRSDSDRRTQFEAMFATHHDAVRRYVVRRQSGALVDDAIADTFLVAWRRLDEIPDRTLPWLLGSLDGCSPTSAGPSVADDR